MQTTLEYIKSKIKYPINIFVNNVLVKGNTDNLNLQIASLQSSNLIVVGDLHANINKALEVMILANLIEIDLEDLKTFYETFETQENFTKADKINLMIKAMSSVKWLDQSRKLIFLGDVLADRVGNDIIGLSFFDIIRKNGGNIEILIGNHDHACNFEDRTNAKSIKASSDSFFNACNIFDNSGEDLQLFYVSLLNKFLTYSKLIMFNSLNKTLFVHSAVRKFNFTTAVKLLKKLEILNPDFDLSIETLIEFCTEFNQFYIDYKVNIKYQDKKYIIENKLLKSIDSDSNRKSEGWLWAGEHLYGEDQEFYTSIGIETIIHGHDSDSQKSIFSPSRSNYNPKNFIVINLDNTNGKDKKFDTEVFPIYIQA